MSVQVIPPRKQFSADTRAVAAPPEKPGMRVAAYCRVSTDMEEQESSYEAQILHYTAFIRENSAWTLAGIYADEGISGTQTKKRDEFNRMIADCEAGNIDMIITKSISRFARNTLDCLQYIRKLKDLNIPVYFEKEKINTMNERGELLITIMASIAQQESQSISQNVRLGIQYRFRQGKPMLQHNWFLGYTKERGGELQIVPEEADTVRQIYRDFLDGLSISDIIHSLESRGIRTGAGREKWYYSTVVSILRNEKYMGDLILQKWYTADFLTKKKVRNNGVMPKYYVEDAQDPIVPREVFMLVQAEFLHREHVKVTSGKRENHRSSLGLYGKIVCGACGNTFRRFKAADPQKTTWRCKTRIQKGTSCRGRIVREATLKEAVVEAMNRVRDRRAQLEDLAAQTDPKAEFDIRRIHIQTLLDLIDAMEGKKSAARAHDALLPAACREPADFFERTKVITHHESVTQYCDADVVRYIDCIRVEPDTMTVVFKAGVEIKVMR